MTDRITLVDAFGKQATFGARRYAGKVGTRHAAIYTLGSGEMDGIDKAYYASGREIPEFDESGNRNWKFHSSDPGIETGPPELIPALPNFKPKGETWVEVLTPADLSEGDDEPQPILWFLRALKVHDYTFNGTQLVQGAKIFSANNALVALFIATQRMKLPLTRFHKWGQSWMDFKTRCAATINYSAVTGLTGQYYDGINFDTLKHTRDDAYIDFTWNDVSPAPSVPATNISVRWSGKVKPRYSETYTFYAMVDDGARLWVNGVQVINDWVEASAHETASSTIALTANTEYDIILEFKQHTGPGRVALSWSSASQAKEIVPQERLVADSRNVERFNAHVAFPQTIPAITAFESVMRRAPGCDWQDVNGAIRILSTPNRAVTHKFTYDLTQSLPPNIIDGSFALRPRAVEDQPNYAIFTYYDLDDPFYKEREVIVDRRVGSEAIKPLGPIPLGICHTSLAQRIAETEMNILRDLSLYVPLRGFADSHKAAKGDVVETSHEVAGWNESDPPQFMVVEEKFTPKGTADDRAFVLRLHSDDYYSDTAHGGIQPRIVSDLPSQFARPPIVDDVSLLKVDRYLPDDTHVPVIQGLVTFASFEYPQRGRVYWKRPGQAFTVDAATDVITSTAHGYANTQEVKVVSTGALPGGLSANTVYFVRDVTANTFKLAATSGGAAINLTSAGTGTHDVYRESDFVATNVLVTPTTDLIGTFEIENVPLGINVFKVVSESLKGVARPLSEALDYAYNVLPLADPVDIGTTFAIKPTYILHQWSSFATSYPDFVAFELYAVLEDSSESLMWTGQANQWMQLTQPPTQLAAGASSYTLRTTVRVVLRGHRRSPGLSVTYKTFTPFLGGTISTKHTTATNLVVGLAINLTDFLAGKVDEIGQTIVEVSELGNPSNIIDTITYDGYQRTFSFASYKSAYTGVGVRVRFQHRFTVLADGAWSSYYNKSFTVLSPDDLPTATTAAKGAVPLAVHNATTASAAVQADDPRLSDARTPTTHNHGTGTVGRGAKFVTTSTVGNSIIYESGSSIGINVSPNTAYSLTLPSHLLMGTTRQMSLVVDYAGFSEIPAGAFFGSIGVNGYTFGAGTNSASANTGAKTVGIYGNGTTFLSAIEWANVASGFTTVYLVKSGGAVEVGGHFRLKDSTAPSASITDGVILWSESVGGSSELRVRDEAGNVTTLSAHAKDAPAWLYDAEDKQPPRIVREANLYAGMIRFTNHTRADRLLQLVFEGKPLTGLSPESRRTIHEETFVEYNTRMKLSAGDPGYLEIEDWQRNQDKIHAERELERAAQAEAVKAQKAWMAENKKRRAALEKWEVLTDEEKAKVEAPPMPEPDPEPLAPPPPKYKAKSAPKWLTGRKR